MTVYSIAMVDSEGEIFHFYHPSATIDPEGACKVGETDATRIHITEEVSDVSLWMRTHYWKFGAWATREDKDSTYYTWTDEAWIFDSDKFMGEVRILRNNKLMESDWTQIPDSPLTNEKKIEWTEYRQELRNVPVTNSSVTDLYQVIWPTKPS
jgi:hypothetical protein